MLKKIAERITYPEWAKSWTRYKRLDIYDRLLSGTFYDHLPHAFFDEIVEGTKKPIPIADRRPSAQYKLPRMVARWTARKLFAGRHRPKLRIATGDDAKPAQKGKPKVTKRPTKAPPTELTALLRRAQFWRRMREAVFWGSVGSVAITFRVEDTGDKARLALTIWKAKYCQPSFDDFGQIAQLRVAYPTPGAGLKALGMTNDSNGKPLEDGVDYWFIRDYLTDRETTFVPVPKEEWNPLNGFVGEGSSQKVLRSFNDIVHDLGFVPGHWFVNLPEGEGSDGDCTWCDAIPNSIDIDYLLSQMGRGTRYNASPQLVVIGTLTNDSDEITRGPMSALQVNAGWKEEDGATVGAGDAKLLEMTGNGIKAGVELITTLRNIALEQIAAARKDPDKMKAPMSGRAMEYLDEDSNDLVMDLRSQYGEDGALPLIRKIAMAAEIMAEAEAGALILQWPRLFQPTPDELFALMQALQIAVDPLGHAQAATPGEPKQPATPSATGPAKPGKPAVPPQDATAPEEGMQFLTMEECRAYVLLNMDMQMLDLEGGEDEEVDESPTSPGDPTEVVPTPSAIDETAPPATPEGDLGQADPSLAQATAAAI